MLGTSQRRRNTSGAIPGEVNIPVDELRDRLDALPPGRRLIIYCQTGQRGYVATRLLRQLGHDAANLSGGYKMYRMSHPDRSSNSPGFNKAPQRSVNPRIINRTMSNWRKQGPVPPPPFLSLLHEGTCGESG